MTFEDLVAVAPLTDTTKAEFCAKYPTFSSEQKMEVLHIFWRAYRILKRFLKQQLRETYTEKMVSGEFTPPEDFDIFLDKEVGNMINEKKIAHAEGQELQEIRSKLATYISSSGT